MSNRNGQQTPAAAGDENVMARLLQIAGPRADVSLDRSARVRESVHQHWQGVVRRRATRRRMTTAIALLSTAAILTLAVRFVLPTRNVAPAMNAVVATVDRAEGSVRALVDGAGSPAARTLSLDTAVYAGEWVATGPAARAALRLSNGVSVRLDAESRARLHSAMIIELVDGALYVDTGRELTGLEVRTPLGTARDIGTQFEVRVRESSLCVRVRDGIVELWRGDRSISARSGTELTVTNGNAVSGPISTFGPEWDWVVGLAPAFEIDGRPLATFLEQISHEYGWTMRYADADLERRAAEIILHGSVSGLTADEALGVTLTTSGLAHQLQDGELLISRTADQDDEGRR